jgi:threonyl-tRNA synthetase
VSKAHTIHGSASAEPGAAGGQASASAAAPAAPLSADAPADHRRLGRELGIFTGDELAGAGFPLWLPDGATIVSELERYIVEVESRAGYHHVRTPPVGKRELYERSGHWQHFAADMFPPMPVGRSHEPDPNGVSADTGQADAGAAASSPAHRAGGRDELVLRPVLCPHHALVYRSRLRSHRDLPLRIGEVGQMFRMERSGVVGGLTRVRAITLNDGHLFCQPERAADEAAAALRQIDEAYKLLGISPAYYRLSLRGDPADGKSYAGTERMWRETEAMLRDALARHGVSFELGPGEAAFYGPKVDVQVYDPQGREFTLSTVQVDMYQPEQFDLEYVAPDGSRPRPVMVHRSMLASMERMVAYLLEAYAGAMPPWLAPVQVLVVPLTDGESGAAAEVARIARQGGLRVEVDDREESLGARIRMAQLRKVPYVAVVGPREAAAGRVSVRLRDGRRTGDLVTEDFVARIRSVVRSRLADAELADHA